VSGWSGAFEAPLQAGETEADKASDLLDHQGLKMALGKDRLIAGVQVVLTKNTGSTGSHGSAVRMTCVAAMRVNLAVTNRLSATGGVTTPISMVTTMITFGGVKARMLLR